MTHRLARFNSLLRQEISELLQRQVKDPRLGSFISVTSVEISPDLSFAKVFISHFGTEEEKVNTLNTLNAAAGFFRHELGDRMKARKIPELSFRADDTIAKADHVLRIMDSLQEKQ
ncbi:MAG: 30S ribosome-binding factor RbfA [Dehalococcoidales bacterium]|nr:30S ribosome-binding factor RbfA [Dehalococcoidales bacterium]